MVRRCPYILVAVACLACGSARANGIIHDPAMGVERGDLSTAIFQGSNFVPAGSGGGVFGFYNASVNNITELMFEVGIAPNLDLTTVQSSFSCDTGNANPFFFYCSVQYVPSTGLLGIAFWGTYPAPTPGTTSPPDEVGFHYGIPPLASGCAGTPDSPGCTDVGHFAITLNDNFSLNGVGGGWNDTNSPGLFTANGVTFTATDISTVFGATPQDLNAPEPATFAMMGGSLIGLGWLVRRRTKKRAAATCPATGRTPGASIVHACAPPA
jgi:PEP-CTERM motif